MRLYAHALYSFALCVSFSKEGGSYVCKEINLQNTLRVQRHRHRKSYNKRLELQRDAANKMHLRSPEHTSRAGLTGQGANVLRRDPYTFTFMNTYHV